MKDALLLRLPALRSRDFRALWGGTASSAVALWTMTIANAWIVFHLSESSAWVGIATFASMSPFLLAPFGGVVADRFERRILVRWTRVAAFAATVLLAVLAYTDVITVGMVVAIAFAQGLVRAVEIPSDQSLLANVVPADGLTSGVTLSTMTQHGSRAVGPLLATPLLSQVGVEGAYAVSALFALLAFTSIRRIETRSRGNVTGFGDVAGSLRAGVHFVARTPAVLAVFGIVVAHCVLTMSFDSMLPGFAEHNLHLNREGFTRMTMGVGIGALVGTASLAFLPGGRGRVFLVCGFVSGLASMAMAGASTLPAAVMAAFVMGASQVMFMAMASVFIQEAVPDGVRGRVMSFYLMSAGGLMAVANLWFGALSDRLGAPNLFLYPGILFLVILTASSMRGVQLRHLYATGRLRLVAAAERG